MIFQKSFLCADLVLKKHFLLSMLKTVMLHFCEDCNTFLGFFDERSTELHIFEMEIFFNNMNVFYCHF